MYAVTAPTITLTRVDPPVDAVRSGGDTSIELRNPTQPLELMDLQGHPWLRINDAGAFTRNADGSFELVRKEPFYYISDGDIARQVTDHAALPYPWHMEGTYGGKPFVMTGTFVPPGARPAGTVASTGGSAALMAGLWLLAVVVVVGALWFFRRRRAWR